jgi:AcrR family transcriptional regulator
MRLTRKSRRARKRLLELLSEGCSISQACAAVGIGRRTFYVWLQNDADFASAVDRAHTRLIAAAERTLQRAIEHGDTRAAMWLLERLAPEYRPVRPAQPLTPEAQDYRVVLEVVDAPEVSFEELLREALETA